MPPHFRFPSIRLALIGLAILLAPHPRAEAQTFQENQLLASYLAGISEFIRWEKSDPYDRMVIAVHESPGLLRELQTYAENRSPLKSELVPIAWKPGDPLDDVDILYLAPDKPDEWPPIIEAAKTCGTVTASSRHQFLQAGGLIQFTRQKNRLRFFLNNELAPEYRVHFSSKLVQIALPPEGKTRTQ